MLACCQLAGENALVPAGPSSILGHFAVRSLSNSPTIDAPFWRLGLSRKILLCLFGLSANQCAEFISVSFSIVLPEVFYARQSTGLYAC
jgi:hypothetical protein